MGPNVMMDRLRAGEILLGLCNMYPASGIIEGMCRGWDFVWIDGQHGQHDYRSLLHAVVTAQSMGVASLVRAPGHDPDVLGQLADQCPSAVLVPMVNSADEAGAVVRALRLPPAGGRSYGGRRVYDLYGRSYNTDCELGVVVQIETLEAVDAVDEIVGTDGVDGVFFGPDDMKIRMGLPMTTPLDESDRLREALKHTAAAANAAGKFAAVPAATPEAATMAVELGYRMLVGGSDVGFMRLGAEAKLASMRAIATDATQGNPTSDASAVY